MDIQTLKQSPLFSILDDEALRDLSTKFTTINLSRGTTLFKEGDASDRMYLIVSGKIKLTRHSKDGRENILLVMGPGEIIGELSLFDEEKRTASAVAVSVSELVSLGNDDLRQLLVDYPKVTEQLLKHLIRRLGKANDSLSDLVFSDVSGRVAKVLVDLATRFGREASEGIHVPHELTQEEVAHLVGSSRETVNKALADFSQRGWIRLGSRRVLILDLDRLRARAR